MCYSNIADVYEYTIQKFIAAFLKTTLRVMRWTVPKW